MASRARSIAFLISLATLVGVQIFSDIQAKDYKASVRRAVLMADTPSIPSETTVAIASLGDRSLGADILWLWMIQYFGSGVGLGKYPSLGPILERISGLDERFAYPYQFAMVVLPFTGQADTAARLGERAISVYPNDGLLTYYLATVYHLNLRQYDRAAELYEKAATLPGSPSAASRLAEVARERESESIQADYASAKAFWQDELEKARNDMEVDRASKWLIHTEILKTLEIANRLYNQKNGAYATSLDQLIRAGIIPQTPVSPVGRRFILKADGSIDDSFEAVN